MNILSKEEYDKICKIPVMTGMGKPSIRITQSAKEGNYLVAKRNISRGEPVVIYWGKIVPISESYERWVNKMNPAEYLEWAQYLRGVKEGQGSVDGSAYLDLKRAGLDKISLNLAGVLANDAAMPRSLDSKQLQIYKESEKICNLSTQFSDSHPFPIYYANRKIRKGEKLVVHYGLGYWLLQLGVPPEKISDYL